MRALADELDMHEFLDRRCDKLSTGMKQKTSIARTLVHDPQVMIFDEPTLGLDVMTARSIVRFVRECRGRGKTVIYSTHVMSEAEKLCDVIGIIHEGTLRAEGTLAELKARTGESDLEECFVQDRRAGGGADELAHHSARSTPRSCGTLLRDRRTLLSTIVIPTFVMPVLVFGFGRMAVGDHLQGAGGDPDGSW